MNSPNLGPLRPTDATNTGECLMGLAGMAQCASGPTASCCGVVDSLDALGCFCNPAVQGADPNLQTMAKSLASVCFASNSSRVFPACFGGGRLMGCNQTDEEIDAMRMQTLAEFGQLLAAARVAPDEETFRDKVNNLTAFLSEFPNVAFYGRSFGGYVGAQNSAEYLVVSPNNDAYIMSQHHFWGWYNTSRSSTLRWEFGCNSIGSVSSSTNLDLDRTQYTAWRYGFDPCSGRFAKMTFYIGHDLVENLLNITSRRSSMKAVCNEVMRRCTGHQPYNSSAECVDYLMSLPNTSPDPACRVGSVLSGNSRSCRFRHHFMMMFQPELHCYHVGKGDMPDADGKFKCHDDECSDETVRQEVLVPGTFSALDGLLGEDIELGITQCQDPVISTAKLNGLSVFAVITMVVGLVFF